MTTPARAEPDDRLELLRRLAAAQATIAGDVFRVGIRTWAIHGFIAVDGDVIIAEYETEAEARLALGALARGDDGAEAR